MLSKVVDFGTNRKRVCDFILVINSNVGPILPRFRYIAGFLFRTATPPLFHPNFGGVPLADVVASKSEDPELIICIITFGLVQPIYARGTSATLKIICSVR